MVAPACATPIPVHNVPVTRRLVLASASPGRLRLLQDAGFDPQVVVSGVDEDDVGGATEPEKIALVLAERKAHAVAAHRSTGSLVIGCDSVLDLDGVAVGKPASPAEAVRRWHTMRGRAAVLVTGHCLIDTTTGASASDVAATTVRFGTPTDTEVEAYVATGESLVVAGGFTLQGRSAPFIDGIDGDPGNVVGLSLPLFRRLAGQLGIEVVSLWS